MLVPWTLVTSLGPFMLVPWTLVYGWDQLPSKSSIENTTGCSHPPWVTRPSNPNTDFVRSDQTTPILALTLPFSSHPIYRLHQQSWQCRPWHRPLPWQDVVSIITMAPLLRPWLDVQLHRHQQPDHNYVDHDFMVSSTMATLCSRLSTTTLAQRAIALHEILIGFLLLLENLMAMIELFVINFSCPSFTPKSCKFYIYRMRGSM